MRNIYYFFYILTLLACSDPEGEGRPFTVRLQMPAEFSQFSPGGTKIKLINILNGTIYSSLTDPDGIASFRIEYGIYRLTAQTSFEKDNIQHLFNTGKENLHLTDKSARDTLTLTLSHSPLSILVIKELYYSGCRDNDGKGYLRDSYVSLYNNSDDIIWLDGICIGTVAPVTSASPSKWLQSSDSIVPITFCGWQFPGNGQEYPLSPGEETIVAVNAVDHTGKDYQHPNSIDLSKADWAFYDESLINNDKAAGNTIPLNLFWSNGTRGYTFTLSGTSIILYKIPGMSTREYLDLPGSVRTEPNSSSPTKYLVIPSKWVLDCIDCVQDATKQGNKRLPSFLDAEPAFVSTGNYSGHSLHRKTISSGESTHPIYQDTNNSDRDFEERIPTLKKTGVNEMPQ